MLTLNNLAAFASQLRQHGTDAKPESKYDAVKGVQAGLVVDRCFYSLAELNEPENQPLVMSRNFKAIRKIV